MNKVAVQNGDVIQVVDGDGNVFEGNVQLPDLDSKEHGKMSTVVVKVKPETLERRSLAEFLNTTVDNVDMITIHNLINPLYNAVRAVSLQNNIDRDARAEEEIYKFINSIRTNLESLYENKG